jgi:hypothetical protein
MTEQNAAPQPKRSLYDILKKYEPGALAKRIFADLGDYSVRADKEKRMLELSLSFPTPVDKEDLYTIEEEIRRAYDLQYVKILPHYPSETFSQGYIPALLMETERIGIVARGFFSNYRANLTDNILTIEVPFETEGGIRLMENGQTPAVIEGILRSEFNLAIKVRIVHSDQLSASYASSRKDRRLEELDAQIAKAETEYNRMMEQRQHDPDFGRSSANAPAEPETAVLPRIGSI